MRKEFNTILGLTIGSAVISGMAMIVVMLMHL